MNEPDPNRIRELFRTRGLRCTRQRELIYAYLASTKTHPTAEEVFQRIAGEEPGLSLATVYNTLDALCAAELAMKLPPADANEPSRFDADVSSHAHVALPDGRVIDVPTDLQERLIDGLSEELARELGDRLGLRIDRLSVQFSAHASEPDGTIGAGETLE